MISSRTIAGLLAGCALLTVAFSVVMAFALLFGALQDAEVARVLRWVGGGCALLLVINLVLLTVAVAIRSLKHDE